MLELLEVVLYLVLLIVDGVSLTSTVKRAGIRDRLWASRVILPLAMGGLAGGFSVWCYPNPFIQDSGLRIASVLGAPLIAATATLPLASISRFRLVFPHIFLAVFLFAFGFAGVRFMLA